MAASMQEMSQDEDTDKKSYTIRLEKALGIEFTFEQLNKTLKVLDDLYSEGYKDGHDEFYERYTIIHLDDNDPPAV